MGQLTKVTLPDGSYLSYTYDTAHRLTGMQDNLGNKIAYTLDAMGNRTQEQVFDPANNLAQTRSRVYSNLNRLYQEIGAAGQTTQYSLRRPGERHRRNRPAQSHHHQCLRCAEPLDSKLPTPTQG